MSVNARIKQRFDYLSNWIQNDIVLLQGELAVVDCGSQIRFKIGDGAKSFTQLPFTDQSQLSTKWLAAEAVSQGIHAASVPYGFAAGAYLCANASFSQALGYDAKALSSDTYSFTWSGDDTRAIGDYYTSHGKGSFSINPLSGLSGVYIGDQRLDQVLADNRGSKISVDGVKADLNIEHLSLSDYMEREASGQLLSNELYIVSTDTFDALGKQVKNMASGTDLSDAVNLGQLTEVSARAYDTYTQSEVDQKIASAQYFKKYVVQTLPPVADADERGIYLVQSTDSQLSNTYDEYVVVGEGSSKAWEKIGAKSIDLSGYKTKQTAKPDPTASSTATAFIDTISQDENGVITATKKNVQAASTSLAGIVQLNNTLTSTATNQAATANAVKTLNDTKLGNTGAQMIAADSAQSMPGTLGIQADSSNLLMLEVSAISLVRPGSGLTPVRFYKLELPEENGTLATKGDIPDVSDFSSVSVDNVKADVNMVHISLNDYNEKLVGGEILSNELYVISADYVETYGQQIKNVADPTDLSDAVNKEYVDSNFQPAGSYLTAVPSDYKTYVATLSSLSSDYSLTSHTHSNYVQTLRKVNNKQLTGDITLNASDVGALALSGGTVTGLLAVENDVNVAGSLTANGGIDVNDGDFAVDSSGNLTACDVHIEDCFSNYYDFNQVDGWWTADQENGIYLEVGEYADSPIKIKINRLSDLTADDAFALTSDLTGFALATDIPYEPSDIGAAPATHNHGQINSWGQLTTTVDIGNGDKIAIMDSSDSNALKVASITFDGNTTSQFLSKKGTWQTALTAVPNTYKTYTDTKSSLSSDGYVLSSRKVAGQALSADVSPATISSAIGLSGYLPLTGGTLQKYGDIWLEVKSTTTNGTSYIDVIGGNGAHSIALYADSTSQGLYLNDEYAVQFQEKDGTVALTSDLGYALATATGTLSSGSYVYDVADRTITTIGINQSSTPVIVRLPAASTYARDFIVRIEISSAAAPAFTFQNTSGLMFESEDDDWAVMEPGLNIVSFTETKR